MTAAAERAATVWAGAVREGNTQHGFILSRPVDTELTFDPLLAAGRSDSASRGQNLVAFRR